jgi:hypothetical protein
LLLALVGCHGPPVGEADGGSAGTSGGQSGTNGAAGAAAGSNGRGGAGGAGGAMCVGTASACAMLDDASCAVVPGCVEGGSCSGQNNGCPGLSMDVCRTIPGCYFLSATCLTATTFCSSFTRRTDCVFYEGRGCSWKPSCAGPTPACGSLGELACEVEPGCTPRAGTGGGTCTGTPTLCKVLGAACGSVAGCYTVDSCGGSPTACAAISPPCDQPGCSSDGASGCMGTPVDCATNDQSGCPGVMGCKWGPVCTGTPIACSKLLGQATCAAQPGCTWYPQ